MEKAPEVYSEFELAGYNTEQCIKLEDIYQNSKDFGITRQMIIDVMKNLDPKQEALKWRSLAEKIGMNSMTIAEARKNILKSDGVNKTKKQKAWLKKI